MRLPLNCLRHFFSFFLCFGVLLLAQSAHGQVKNVGLPLITNYLQSTYKASPQNWEMIQNSLGFLYFANNDGLLEFDGEHWNIYPVPNKSIIRSLKAVNDTLYVGAYEELGYFAADSSGKLKYNSLVPLVPKQFRNFDEVWKIHLIDKTIVFHSFKFQFFFDSKQLRVEESKQSFGHSFPLANGFAYVDHPNRLMAYFGGQTRELANHPLLSASELRSVIPFGKDKYLLAFVDKGLFILEDYKLKSWDTDVNKWLRRNSIFSAMRLSGGNLAFGSIQDGLIIADDEGRILQQLDRVKGLQNNTILCMFEDMQGNLWLGLDNGIDMVEINSPLSIFDHTFHIESVYATAVFDHNLYVGTNQGLFYLPLDQLNNSLSTDNRRFSLIEGTEGQVWSLEVVNNSLLCGHNFGLFQVKGNKALKVNPERGYWSMKPIAAGSDTLLCGTYSGFVVAVFKNKNWFFSHQLKNFEVSARNFVFLPDKNEIWMAHGYRGLYHLKINNTLDSVVNSELFHGTNGLINELPYNVFNLLGNTVFATEKGCMQFDTQTGNFVEDSRSNALFGKDVIVNQVFTDASGSIWYCAAGKLGLLKRIEDGSYSNVTAPFLRINHNLVRSFENVYVYDSRNVFIGTKSGLIHYDPFYRKDYSIGKPLIFREIEFYSDNKKELKINQTGEEMGRKKGGKIAKPFSMNGLRIVFANPEFNGSNSSLFSFRLKGIDDAWTPWSPLTFKEYNNLPDGNYLFELRSKGIGNNDEKYASFEFKILPPFYRTSVAYLIYVLLLISLVIGNVFFMQKRVMKTRQKEIEKHAKAMEEQEQSFREKALIAEKEIIDLRNQSLQSQVSHKTKELANNALNLIHKNKFLYSIKSQLNAILDSGLSQSKRSQIESIIHKINKELKSEKFQEVFDDYFDDVHQHFIARLKESHPQLTPRELRLCAYLKMNLSTKEIAPLMNISVRGVEIGRYRLRKKLGLEHDENLIDYLIKF